jgi:hypothetical protein
MAKDLAAEAATAAAAQKTEKVAKERKRPALSQPTINMPEDLSDIVADILMAENKSFAQYTLPMIVDDLKKRGKVKADYALDFTRKGGGGNFIKKLKEDSAAKDKAIADLQAQLAKLQAAKK